MAAPMVSLDRAKLRLAEYSKDKVGYFRFKKHGDRYLISNLIGDWMFLTEDEFDLFVTGKMPEGPKYEELKAKSFLKHEQQIDKMADRFRARSKYLDLGPVLHIAIVTLRCNETCVYCHASRTEMDQVQTDMDEATARKFVELVFQSPSPEINIEFQGGEPTVNFPIMKLIIELAEEKNRLEGRNINFVLVSNLAYMTEEKMKYLIDHEVSVCTSIDGPSELHEKQRILVGGHSFYHAMKWRDRFLDEYTKRGIEKKFWINALQTTTRNSLSRPREIVDEYVRLGIWALHLRPLDPFGFAQDVWERVGYTAEEFWKFYMEAFTYIMELNRRGVQVLERGAALLLMKILTDDDPNYMEARTPSGSGIGQIATSYDGRVYTCDEGRMLSAMGDETFQIGNVHTHSYSEMMRSAPVRACVVSSNQLSVPGCSTCAYQPFCGLTPVHSYLTQGNVFGRLPDNSHCQLRMKMFNLIFNELGSGNAETETIFKRWIAKRYQLGGDEDGAQGAPTAA